MILYFCDRCEADPVALAKYVLALVKKDKPEEVLRSQCIDQLYVFLSHGELLLTTYDIYMTC